MRKLIAWLLGRLTDKAMKKTESHPQQHRPDRCGKVYLPKFLGIIGIIGTVIFWIPAVITLLLGIELWTPILFFMTSLPGILLIIGYINCRISYDEDGFVAKNFFGIKRRYTYYDVTAIRENEHESFIYMGKHRIMVDRLSIGGKDFIVQIKKKYSALNNRKMLPRIKPKFDLFNGHVPNSGGALFAFILVAVFLIGFILLMVYYTYAPSTTRNTIKHSVCFESYRLTTDELRLYSTDGQLYAIRFFDDQFDAASIYAICDGKTVVTTYSTEVSPDGEDYYSVKAIVLNGTELLTFEETNRFHKEEYWPLILLSSGMLLFWCVYVTGSVIVGRNPKKFSKRTVRFFFKDGYIRY